MPEWLTPRRRTDPELMDQPGLPPGLVGEAHRVLRRVNRQLGNRRTLRRELGHILEAEGPPGGPIRVLDVGSGSGDLPAAARDELAARGRLGGVVVLDLDPVALHMAVAEGLGAVRGDALRLPFAGRSFDLVTATKFAHHFHGPPLARLVGEMTRVARRWVVIVEIRRHWLAYAGFVAWSRLLTRNRLVRHDGPLSVLRGFTRDELLQAAEPHAEFAWTVEARPPFQLVLRGRRTRD